jgi:hypothetical protein
MGAQGWIADINKAVAALVALREGTVSYALVHLAARASPFKRRCWRMASSDLGCQDIEPLFPSLRSGEHAPGPQSADGARSEHVQEVPRSACPRGQQRRHAGMWDAWRHRVLALWCTCQERSFCCKCA